MNRELVQKHRVCQIAAQPDLEKMIRKLEEVAQGCPEKVQKRPRDKREWLRQGGISSTFGMKVAFRSITRSYLGALLTHCLTALFTTHSALLPQPLPLVSRSLLYFLWASLGYLFKLSDHLFKVWLGSNLADSVFLHQLPVHPSFSSIRLSIALLVLHSPSIKFNGELVYLCTPLQSSGKSVPFPIPLYLLPQLY